MANVVGAEKELSLEEEIISILKNPPDIRYLMEIPLQLISEEYNKGNIVELAKRSEVGNKLGYLADFSLLLLERHAGKLKGYIEARVEQVRENLQYVSQELEKYKKEDVSCLDEELRFCAENAPARIRYLDKHPQNREFCKNLEGRWNVIGVFGVEEMYDYMRFIMTESRKTVSQLSIEELVR